MSASVEMYREDLDTLEWSFKTLMWGRYLSALTNNYMTDASTATAQDSDNHRKLDSLDVQRKQILAKTFILASRIGKDIDATDAKSLSMDNRINELKKKYEDATKRLNADNDADLAAKPLKKEMKKDMITTYFYAGYYSIAILSGCYFIYKKFKS